MACNAILQASQVPYPRTCGECGLGPCSNPAGMVAKHKAQKPTVRQQLHEAIAALPTFLRADPVQRLMGDVDRTVTTRQPVMRGWTTELPLRHQGVLVSSIRGCDGAPKVDPSKRLSVMIRRAILNPADERETSHKGGFFGFDHEALERGVHDFCGSMDQYPLHYVTHLMHAYQVIGHKNPDPAFRAYFDLVYSMMVHKMHLNVETVQDMDARLTTDRIATNTVETDYPSEAG